MKRHVGGVGARTLVGLCVVVASCTGSSPPPGGSPQPTTTGPTTTGPTTTAPGPVETGTLPEVVLTARVGEERTGWELLAKIPFGPARDELGYFPETLDTQPGITPNLATVPRSFAISADGTLWVLDALKERVAHFARDGTFLGQVGRFPWESPWEAWDVVWEGDDLLVMEWNAVTAGARVTVLSGEDQAPPTPLVLEGRLASVDDFLPGAGRVTGRLHGFAGALTGGIDTWATLDVPGSGAVAAVPGIPLSNGTFVAVDQVPGDPEVEVSFIRPGLTSVQPFRIRLLDPDGRRLDTFAAALPQGALPAGVVVLVPVFPRAPRLIDRYGEDPWMLVVSSDGTALDWGVMPEPTISDETQERRLTVGADGRIYAMVADDDGDRIYVRT